jgi:hypothetical protein
MLIFMGCGMQIIILQKIKLLFNRQHYSFDNHLIINLLPPKA